MGDETLRASAHMARRRGRPGDPDFYPTPPWATRALFAHVIPDWFVSGVSIWEPACGAGHMSYVLEEFCENVSAN